MKDLAFEKQLWLCGTSSLVQLTYTERRRYFASIAYKETSDPGESSATLEAIYYVAKSDARFHQAKWLTLLVSLICYGSYNEL